MPVAICGFVLLNRAIRIPNVANTDGMDSILNLNCFFSKIVFFEIYFDIIGILCTWINLHYDTNTQNRAFWSWNFR